MTDSLPLPASPRHDGWTSARQLRFIEELSVSGNVTQAAQTVGMSRSSAYQFRNRDLDSPFAKAWAIGLLQAAETLAETAFARAIEGQVTPVFYKGEQIGERRRYDNRLLMFMLRTRDPAHYGRSAEIGCDGAHMEVMSRPERFREALDAIVSEAGEPGFRADVVSKSSKSSPFLTTHRTSGNVSLVTELPPRPLNRETP